MNKETRDKKKKKQIEDFIVVWHFLPGSFSSSSNQLKIPLSLENYIYIYEKKSYKIKYLHIRLKKK